MRQIKREDKTCGNCAHFTPYLNTLEPKPGKVGSCDWEPPVLPMSWDYSPREVTGVSRNDDATCCDAWQPMQNYSDNPDSYDRWEADQGLAPDSAEAYYAAEAWNAALNDMEEKLQVIIEEINNLKSGV